MSSTPAQPLDPPCQSETLTLPIDRRRAHPERAPWQMENPSIWVCFGISKALFIETSCECTGKSISSIPGLVNGSFPAAGSSSAQKTHVPRLGESSSNIKFTQLKIHPTRNSPSTKFTQHQIHLSPNPPKTNCSSVEQVGHWVQDPTGHPMGTKTSTLASPSQHPPPSWTSTRAAMQSPLQGASCQLHPSS